MNSKPRYFIQTSSLFYLVLILAMSFVQAVNGQSSRPNILFILVDDQSPFDLKVYNKDSIIDSLLTETHIEIAVSDFNVREMSINQAQATYVATNIDTGAVVRRSSVWRYQHGIWLMAFHRGTSLHP